MILIVIMLFLLFTILNSSRINIKQKVRRRIQQMNIDIFSNLTLLFIHAKMAMVKGVNLESMICQKVLSRIKSSSMEITFITNHLILK